MFMTVMMGSTVVYTSIMFGSEGGRTPRVGELLFELEINFSLRDF